MTKNRIAVVFLLAMGVLFLFAVPCFASSDYPLVAVVTDTGYTCSGIEVDGRTLVPLRNIAESMDCKVQWDAEEQSVRLTTGSKSAKVYIGKKTAEIDGVHTQIDVAPTIVNDKTYVPARVICEALGATVDWDGTRVRIFAGKLQTTPPTAPVTVVASTSYANICPEFEYMLKNIPYTTLDSEGNLNYWGPDGLKKNRYKFGIRRISDRSFQLVLRPWNDETLSNLTKALTAFVGEEGAAEAVEKERNLPFLGKDNVTIADKNFELCGYNAYSVTSITW